MKIEMLELKELEIVEVNGEFEQRYINSKKYPVFLTNAALRRGRDLGLIESSLIGELTKLQGLQGLDLETLDDEDDQGLSQLEKLAQVDDGPMINVIYLAFIGANKSVKMDFEEFLELYHLDFTQTITLYASLISASFTGENSFAKGFQSSTASSKKK